MIRFWRLNERTVDNLGLACTEDGLFLGRTPLVERRNSRFAVRERGEVERLLKRAYQGALPVDRLMPGLTTVAAALNADDQCLARIAAVHLQIPDLPSEAARDGLESEDRIIKSVDWNPALHPRTGTRPNPGWFAPTDGEGDAAGRTRIAQNEDRSRATDATAGQAERRAQLPPGERIDELGDFLEWLANAKPEDEKAIRAEIKRYYYDVGDTFGGNALNAALGDVLEPGVTPEIRQKILDGIAPHANADPAEVAQARNLVVGGILLFSGKPRIPAVIDAPSEAWKLGWAARGNYIHEQLGANLPHTFKVIDRFLHGVATSIKSIDLKAATYQGGARLAQTLTRYVNKLHDYKGSSMGNIEIRSSDIKRRLLNLAIPKGAITETQRTAIETVRREAGYLA
jgi:CDI toxin restriction endonuclease-like domain